VKGHEWIAAAFAGLGDDIPSGLSYADVIRRCDEDPAWQRRIDGLIAELDAEDAEAACVGGQLDAGTDATRDDGSP
jgi:hypothetical protein